MKRTVDLLNTRFYKTHNQFNRFKLLFKIQIKVDLKDIKIVKRL